MAVMDGCEAKYRTPIPEERTCPNCGAVLEVFTVQGKVREEVKCDCGYVIPAEEPDSPAAAKK